MSDPSPIYMGQLGPVKAGDAPDEYLDIAEDLAAGETVSSVAFTVTNAAGTVVSGVVGAHTDGGTRTDFRVAAPATAGMYTITAVFTISDGQKLTRTASLWVV
jgi:hypothetical protein